MGTEKKAVSLKKERDRDKLCGILYPVLLFGITLAVHLYVALRLDVLHMSHDEMGVLATAAYAVGEDWSGIVSHIGYYGYGSSVLYIPIFMITNGAVLRYKLVAALNSVLMSLIPLIAYRIGTKYCKADRLSSFAAALVTGLYPGYLLYSKWAWNETMMCLLPWVTLLAVFVLYNAKKMPKKIIFSVILSFLLVYSYAVHGRALALIGAVMVIIAAVLIFQRRLMVEPVSFIVSFGAFFAADHFIKDYVTSHVWLITDASQMNNTAGSTAGKIGSYMNHDGFMGLLRIAAGQLSAASASTYGILIIAAIPAIPLIFKGLGKSMRLKKEDSPGEEHGLWMLSLAAMLFFAAAFAISVIFLGEEGSKSVTRGDYYIYTRYFSNMLGLAIFTMFMLFTKKSYGKLTYIFIIAAYAVCDLPILRYADFLNSQPDTSNATILNLLAYLGDNPRDYVSYLDFDNLLFITALVFGGVLLAASGKRLVMLCPMLSLVFVGSYLTTADNVLLANSEVDYSFVQPAQHVLAQAEGLEDSYSDVYYYNVHQAKPWSSSAMQFALPDYEVTEFDFEISDKTDPDLLFSFITKNSIIISSEDIELEQFSDDIYRLDTPPLNSGTEYMWVYGDDIKNYILKSSDIEIADED